MNQTNTILSGNVAVPALVVLLAAGVLTPGAAAHCDLDVGFGETYIVNGTETYGSVCVQRAGKILIPPGAKLQVEFRLSVAPTASIEFTGTGSPSGRFIAWADMTMDGTFRVTGSAGGVLASRESTAVLTISNTGVVINPAGRLRILGVVLNHGRITAAGTSNDYDITFSAHAPHPESTGFFEVTHPNAQMIFDTGSGQTFTGNPDFLVTAGRLYIRTVDLETNGGLKVESGGEVEVGLDRTFRATGTYGG